MVKTKIDPKKSVLKKSKEIGSGKIQGYDFDKPFDAKKFFDSFKDTGFQATNLGKAIELVKKMQETNSSIYLGFTSNIGTCGLRDNVAYLAKNKLVNVMVTTTGGLEEDIIKTYGDFLHGDFNADGGYLRENGVNRTGNIFIPNERYIWFEKFVKKVFESVYTESKKSKKRVTSATIIRELGKALETSPKKEESFVYWAYKNNIKLFCIPLHDGAIGDHLYFFRKEHPDFEVDMVSDVEEMIDRVLNEDKIGAILIGGSVPKHFIMNSCMMREGADYTVYINTGYEGEGSNAGANVNEAKSWGKATPDENNVKVWGEASIIFPLLIAAGFKLK
ncbi:MAG: deoxyhypusine synthase [archaeon]|jgi:deoxyhypusine synthase